MDDDIVMDYDNYDYDVEDDSNVVNNDYVPDNDNVDLCSLTKRPLQFVTYYFRLPVSPTPGWRSCLIVCSSVAFSP